MQYVRKQSDREKTTVWVISRIDYIGNSCIVFISCRSISWFTRCLYSIVFIYLRNKTLSTIECQFHCICNNTLGDSSTLKKFRYTNVESVLYSYLWAQPLKYGILSYSSAQSDSLIDREKCELQHEIRYLCHNMISSYLTCQVSIFEVQSKRCSFNKLFESVVNTNIDYNLSLNWWADSGSYSTTYIVHFSTTMRLNSAFVYSISDLCWQLFLTERLFMLSNQFNDLDLFPLIISLTEIL